MAEWSEREVNLVPPPSTEDKEKWSHASTAVNAFTTLTGTTSPLYILKYGHAVAQLVEALRYKTEGCRLDSQWSL